MTDATAKFPGTTGIAQLAQVDVGGELVGIGEAEWTTNGATLIGAVAPFSLVVNEAISARVPSAGWLTTANNEVLHYNAVNTGTKTFTIDARAQQDTAAAAIDTATWVGLAVTKRWYNQVIAEIIAMQTEMFKDARPNLVLNSDFSRRTVLGLAMPEAFADTSGYVVVSGAAPTVASNIVTSTAANELAWCNQSFVWRNGRASATFKAVATAGQYRLKWRQSATQYVVVEVNAGTFAIYYNIGAGEVGVASVGQALTLNRWYWLEIDVQGDHFVAKIYDTSGTAAGVTKASSTLLQTLALAIIDFGASHISISSNQANAQWGGIAAGNGGVYVETWLPESWPVDFGGTLGGQAIGYNEGTDVGATGTSRLGTSPLRAYVPATSRALTLRQNSDSSPTRRTSTPIAASTPYAQSIYVKTTGASGAGLLTIVGQTFDSSLANVSNDFTISDAAEAVWTRKTVLATTPSTARFVDWFIQINPNVNRTGTVDFQLPQLEQGSAVTAWRNAPADDAPIVWELVDAATTPTTTGAAEVNSRDNAGNLFFPWDCTLHIDATGTWSNSGTNTNSLGATLDGAFLNTNYSAVERLNTATFASPVAFSRKTSAAAGKHRIALAWTTSAGTATMLGTSAPTAIRVTAFRGK